MKKNTFRTFLAVFICFATVLTQIGAAGAEPAKASYMPLRHEEAVLDLSYMLPDELTHLTADTILANLKDTAGNRLSVSGTIVAYSLNEDEYVTVRPGQLIDLSVYRTAGSFYFTFAISIVCGNKADQLGTANVIYDVELAAPSAFITAKAFPVSDTQRSDGSNIAVRVETGNSYLSGSETGYAATVLDGNVWNGSDPVALSFSSPIAGVTARVYEGLYSSVSDIPSGAVDIASKVWNNDREGYVTDKTVPEYSELTFVLQRDSAVMCYPALIALSKTEIEITAEGMCFADNGKLASAFWSMESSNYSEEDCMQISATNLLPRAEQAGYTLSSSFYFVMSAYRSGSTSLNISDYVTKAVVGLYDTLEAAQSAPDIKDDLFVASTSSWFDLDEINGIKGYQADYSGEGVFFTIFTADGDVLHYNVTAVTESYSSPEYHGAELDSISVVGTDGQSLTAFSLNSRMDSSCDSGFWTVLFLEENGYDALRDVSTGAAPAPASGGAVAFIPVFDASEGAVVTASVDGGAPVIQESGRTVLQYTEGVPVKYTVTASDGSYENTYSVAFVTQKTGSALYVNGMYDPDAYVADGAGSVLYRDVFLDTGGYHDIFFTSIGDRPVTGLYARLENAVNVKIDPYWSIGDTTTLAAFTTTDYPAYENYGSHENIGKIRLISDCKSDSGEVSGYLVIGYTGGEEIRIKLGGSAGRAKPEPEFAPVTPAPTNFVVIPAEVPEETAPAEPEPEVTHNSDGSVTTESITSKADGTVVSETVTEYENGTKTVETVTVDANGDVISTVEEKTTVSKKGTVTVKTVETNADGSVVTETVKTTKDGEISLERTETNPEGNVTEISSTAVTDENGMTKIVTGTVQRDERGKAVSETEITVIGSKDGTAKLTGFVSDESHIGIPASVAIGDLNTRITAISKRTFKGNEDIESVVIGSNIKKIGKEAFRGDKNLKLIELSASIRMIYKNAFKGTAKNAVFRIHASSDKSFERMVRMLKKAGAGKGATFERVE